VNKILVVEDETNVRENIVEILGYEGYDVTSAENGKVALDLLQKQGCPDLILCDIAMPELDGYDFLAEIRQKPEMAAIPFIFLTARTDRPFMRHGMELGADDYLTKPFSTAELLAAIHARFERQRLQTEGLEQKIEGAKRQLVDMVAHELRTPLVSIQMALDIISRQIGQLSPTQLQDMLGYVERGSNRLHHLVEQMVFITKLEAHVLTSEEIIQYGLVSHISEILMASTSMARSFAPRNPDVSVRLDVREDRSMVLADVNSLKHALAEIITNAVNFSPQGSEVVITQWEADQQVMVSILDQGPGIPPDQLENALGEFKQIDRQLREQQGMGLGLPLARRIVEAHRGTFEIRSVVGKGTQVTITLPAAEEPAE
jgi:two-component system, sensor histidine kinase and response regulator